MNLDVLTQPLQFLLFAVDTPRSVLMEKESQILFLTLSMKLSLVAISSVILPLNPLSPFMVSLPSFLLFFKSISIFSFSYLPSATRDFEGFVTILNAFGGESERIPLAISTCDISLSDSRNVSGHLSEKVIPFFFSKYIFLSFPFLIFPFFDFFFDSFFSVRPKCARTSKTSFAPSLYFTLLLGLLFLAIPTAMWFLSLFITHRHYNIAKIFIFFFFLKDSFESLLRQAFNLFQLILQSVGDNPESLPDLTLMFQVSLFSSLFSLFFFFSLFLFLFSQSYLFLIFSFFPLV